MKEKLFHRAAKTSRELVRLIQHRADKARVYPLPVEIEEGGLVQPFDLRTVELFEETRGDGEYFSDGKK